MGTIRLTTKFIFFAFLLYLFPAHAQIDNGSPMKVGWTTRDLEVEAGTHTVEVYFPYLFGLMPRAGANRIQVEVPEGGTVGVSYRAPWLVFLPGKISSP